MNWNNFFLKSKLKNKFQEKFDLSIILLILLKFLVPNITKYILKEARLEIYYNFPLHFHVRTRNPSENTDYSITSIFFLSLIIIHITPLL